MWVFVCFLGSSNLLNFKFMNHCFDYDIVLRLDWKLQLIIIMRYIGFFFFFFEFVS